MLEKSRPLSSLFLLLLLQTHLQILSPARAAFSEEERQEFVLAHNRLRQSVYPTASAMNYITWSANLADLAGKAAESCSSSHGKSASIANLYQSLGENMYLGPKETASPYNVTMTWYSERSHFNISQSGWVTKPGCSTDYYSNMMATDVTEFGCDFIDCNETRLVFCEYSKKSSGAAYELGPVCSACPADRPFCLGGLCIDKSLAVSEEGKRLDPTVQVECKMACRMCGKVNSSTCDCDCRAALGTGRYCDTNPDMNKTCDPCGNYPACKNGGIKFASPAHPPLNSCACICPFEFVGDLCEIEADVQLSSMRLTFSMYQWFRFGSQAVKLPVSKSQFNVEIWSLKFRSALAKAITSFCQLQLNFFFCCNGKALSEEAATKGKSYVGPDDVQHFKNTVENTVGGELQVVLFINLPRGNTLCKAGKNIPNSQAVRTAPIREFVRSRVVELATFGSLIEIRRSLPPGVTIKSIENLDSRFDTGEFNEAHWTFNSRKSAPEVDNSNITTCEVKYANKTVNTGAVKLATIFYFQLTVTILTQVLISIFTLV